MKFFLHFKTFSRCSVDFQDFSVLCGCFPTLQKNKKSKMADRRWRLFWNHDVNVKPYDVTILRYLTQNVDFWTYYIPSGGGGIRSSLLPALLNRFSLVDVDTFCLLLFFKVCSRCLNFDWQQRNTKSLVGFWSSEFSCHWIAPTIEITHWYMYKICKNYINAI